MYIKVTRNVSTLCQRYQQFHLHGVDGFCQKGVKMSTIWTVTWNTDTRTISNVEVFSTQAKAEVFQRRVMDAYQLTGIGNVRENMPRVEERILDEKLNF